ncbi:hypothetical protein Tco_1533018 [Tanacetum coccineum]
MLFPLFLSNSIEEDPGHLPEILDQLPFSERKNIVKLFEARMRGGMFPRVLISSDPSDCGVVFSRVLLRSRGVYVHCQGVVLFPESLGMSKQYIRQDLGDQVWCPMEMSGLSDPRFWLGWGGDSLVVVGGLLDLGFFLFLESAPEASGPCDLGKVRATV